MVGVAGKLWAETCLPSIYAILLVQVPERAPWTKNKSKRENKVQLDYELGLFLITPDEARSTWQKTVRVLESRPWGCHTQGSCTIDIHGPLEGNVAGSTHFPRWQIQQTGPSPRPTQQTPAQPRPQGPAEQTHHPTAGSEPLHVSESLTLVSNLKA